MRKATSILASVLLVGTALIAAPQAAHATSYVGKYYVGSENGNGSESIFEFDPLSGQTSSTALATFAATNYLTSLEVDGTNGIAYAVSYSYGSARTQFWTIDLGAGSATLTNSDMSSTPGANDRNFSDLALDPITGTLYGRSDSSTDIFIIDKSTGQTSSVGTITGSGFPANGFGLAISSSQKLIATSGGSGVSPNRATTFGVLNTSTAAVMPFGKAVVNGNAGGVPVWAADFTEAGDLVLVGSVGRATISAATLATLDLVGTGFVSSTATTSVSATSAAGYMPGPFAIANTAPAASRTISYDANLGAGSEAATSGSGSLTLSSGSSLTRTGYTLSGWNTAANGSGTALALGSSYTPSANITIYAQWTAVPVAASAKYEGPLFTPIAKRNINSVTGGTLTLEGRSLSKVTKVSLNGSDLSSEVNTVGGIDVKVPAGKPGSADLKITFLGGSLVWENAFQYVDPASIKPEFVYHEPKPSKPVKKPTKVKTKVKK